jgi:hypothetical protein
MISEPSMLDVNMQNVKWHQSKTVMKFQVTGQAVHIVDETLIGTATMAQ